jgi:hypothetical protein
MCILFSSSVASYLVLQAAINTLAIFLNLNTDYHYLPHTESFLPWVCKKRYRVLSANAGISNVIVSLIIEKDD